MNEVGCVGLDSSGEDGRDEFQVSVGKSDWTVIRNVSGVLVLLVYQDSVCVRPGWWGRETLRDEFGDV